MAERVQIMFNQTTQLHTEYRRAMPTQAELEHRREFNRRKRAGLLSNDELERERNRTKCSHVANAIKALGLSYQFAYFNTFTTDNLALALDGRALLKAVQTYLIEQNATFLCVLEAFDNDEQGFHVHALTDKHIDFFDWFTRYGGIRVADSIRVINGVEFNNFDERWDANLAMSTGQGEVNLYSEKIRLGQDRCVSYIIKKVSDTKKRLPKYATIYKHNLDNTSTVKIDAIIDDNGEMILGHVNDIGEYLIRKYNSINNGINEKDFIIEELRNIKHLRAMYSLQCKAFPKSKKKLLKFIENDLERYNRNCNITFNEMTDNNYDIMQGIINRINDSNTDIDVDLDSNNTNNTVITAITTANVPQKFHYVCTEEQKEEKYNDFGIIKSNTEAHSALIPFENAMKIEKIQNFANFLILYIGYICHIPD